MFEPFPELVGERVTSVEVGTTGFFLSRETIKLRFSIGIGMILYTKRCPLRVVWGWEDEIGHHYKSPLRTENFTGVKEGKIIDASAYMLPAFTSGNPLPKLLEFTLILERDDGMEGTFSVKADTDSVREQDQWEARLAMKEYK